MESEISGKVFNIGGGSRISVNKTIELIEKVTGKEAYVIYQDSQKGDMMHTAADISKASGIGYSPRVAVEEGIRKEIEWIKSLL